MGAVLAPVVAAVRVPTTSSVRRDHEKYSRPVCCCRSVGVAAGSGRRAGPWQQRQHMQGRGHRRHRWEQRSRAPGPGEEVPGASAAGTGSASSAAASAATGSAASAATGSATSAAASAATGSAASAATGSATSAAAGSAATAAAGAAATAASGAAAASSALKPAVWAASGARCGVRGRRWQWLAGPLLG